MYGTANQTMPCAVEGDACFAHLEGKKGRGKAISFKKMMESDHTLVASAVIKFSVHRLNTYQILTKTVFM